MTTAIVPFKTLSEAKSRLAGLLSPADRSALAMVMLADVLTALTQSQSVNHIIVTTCDQAAQRLAQSLNITLMNDVGTNLNHSLELAIANVDSKTSILIIHADLPLVEAVDIDDFINNLPHGGVALAGSHDGGTTAMAFATAIRMKLSFGSESFRHHWSAANTAEIPVFSIHEGPITFDIDRPDDLLRLRNKPGERQTGKLLSGLILHPTNTYED